MPNSVSDTLASGRLSDCLDAKFDELEITPMHARISTRISRVKVAKDWWKNPQEVKPTCWKGDFVAKKLMRTTDREEWKRVCEQEFQILSRCECQNIVAAFDVRLDYVESDPNSFPFYLMELAESSLHFVLTTKRVDDEFLYPSDAADSENSCYCYTYERCKSWLLQVAKGMDFLHSKEILHRDLKSLNVLMFDCRTTCKLCDFDLSRQLDPCGMTPEKGTWRWMAPELRRRSSSSSVPDVKDDKTVVYGAPADCYSFGVLVCESLFRETPFACYEDAAFVCSDDAIPETPTQEEVAMLIVKNQEDGAPSVRPRRESAVFKVEDRLWRLLSQLLSWTEPEKRPTFSTIISIFESLGAKSQPPLHPKTDSDCQELLTDTGLQAGASVTSYGSGHSVTVAYAMVKDGGQLTQEQAARVKKVVKTFAGNICVRAAEGNTQLEEEFKDARLDFKVVDGDRLQLSIFSHHNCLVQRLQRHCSNSNHMKWMASHFESDKDCQLRSLTFTMSQ